MLHVIRPIARFSRKSVFTAFFILSATVCSAAEADLPARKPFYIVPTVEGLLFCDEARNDPKQVNFAQAQAACEVKGRGGSAALNRLLEELEPGGAKGQVQVGYLLTVQLLSLYKAQGKEWVIDERRVDSLLRMLTEVKRPAVVYLQSTHFDTQGPLPTALAKDPRNLLLFADGKPPELGYFGFAIAPFTLSTDMSLPVNAYRFAALRHVIKRMLALPAEARERIVGISLAGEAHQLFPDFENGMGAYEDIRVTDYSAASVAGFRRMLEKRYGSIEKLNAAMGLSETSFASVPAPSKNIRKESLTRFSEHYDAWADGHLPVSGWLFDPENRVNELLLYVDGKLVGPVQRGMNRLDVYRAVEEITTPNTGFRYDLDFSAMSVGRHRAQVVAVSGKDRYLLAEAPFVVVGRDQAKVSDDLPAGVQDLKTEGSVSRVRAFLDKVLRKLGFNRPLPNPTTLQGVRSWLDMPRSLQDVYYNPLAREWNRYRDDQTVAFMTAFFNIAREAGLPAQNLFSHQIIPRINSSWNPQLFAVDSSLQRNLPWRPGINMYGGTTHSAWLRGFMKERDLTDYGAPEFHPQQWKQPDAAMAALREQYDAGARFISPMYFSLVPDRFKGAAENGVNRMEIRPDNSKDGSDQFYRAIRDFARN
ncbi:hypothetical protein [Ottowia thiooxydans]|uniref:hypothetical protein n=1 Tax=Ottowia thiooxydans TaxID=219182 RepID=UPI0004211BAA|nr:hypothetical protein [Ottowia thiooxydans]